MTPKLSVSKHVVFLLAVCLLPGCGEPEQSRVAPAADSPRASDKDRQAGDKASSEATIPKNIPMH
jgi:hypothetical protein